MNLLSMRCILLIIFISKACLTFSQTSPRDVTFNVNGTGASSVITSMYVEDDGNIIIGGWFEQYNGQSAKKIARLEPDGSLDPSFEAETSGSSDVSVVASAGDSKVIVGFTATTNALKRFNHDGSEDTNFSSNIGTGPNNSVFAVATQPDGKILVGGGFSMFDSQPLKYLIRLNTDGTVDNAFAHTLNFHVRSIILLGNGDIVLGGSGNGASILAKLHSDGTIDNSFVPKPFLNGNDESVITSMISQPGGKTLIGGFFSSYGDVPRKNIVRINSDGSIDDTYSPTFNSLIRTLFPVEDYVMVGGQFNEVNGSAIDRLVLLDADGNIFVSYTGTENLLINQGFFHQGKVVIAGSFEEFVGTTVGNITRLSVDLTKSLQTITFPEIDLKAFGSSAFELAAIATSGLQVTYQSSNEKVIKVEGNTAIITGAGSATITGFQPGNESYFPASPVARVVQVKKANQNILFTAIPELTTGELFTQLEASSSSGLDVYYRSSDSSIAIVEGNIAMIKGEGETTITAYQDGNENYNAAFPVSKILKVNVITGYEPMNLPQLYLYPNPTTNKIVIQSNINASGRFSYTIYNLDNTLISSVVNDSFYGDKLIIDFSEYPTGTYIILLKFNGKQSMQKVIKI